MRPALWVLIVLAGILPAGGVRGQDSVPTAAEPPDPAAPSQVFDAHLQRLGARILEWRAVQQPWQPHPGSRLPRPDGWKPEWTAGNLAIWRVMVRDFLERLEGLDRSAFSPADHTDLQLLEAACKRVGWELDVLRLPHRDPMFWVEQALGPVFDALAAPEPMTAGRIERVIAGLRFVPVVLGDAGQHLDAPVQAFALAAIESLVDIRDRLTIVRQSLQEVVPAERRADFNRAVNGAADALEAFAAGLQRELSAMDANLAIGSDRYAWYLAQVALVPADVGAMQVLAEQARYDAIAQLVVENQRHPDVPDLPSFDSVDILSRAAAQFERELRAFVTGRSLATVPDELPPWRPAPLPAWLAPLAFLGAAPASVTTEGSDGALVRYLAPEPPESGFGDLGAWRDPRPLIAIEGIPGRSLQRIRSRDNPDPLRRMPLADAQGEGIAAYLQELLLGYGLWDFSPATRRIVLQFQRLHAVQAEADIRLATGELSLTEATDFVAQSVPLDRDTAATLALRLARDPGRGIAALTGRLQALGLLAEVARAEGSGFALQAFNDRLLANAHVPLSLLRSEALGTDDRLDRARRLTERPATVPQ